MIHRLSLRRHYPVQVHGSLALARQTLSVAPMAIWLPERLETRTIRGQRQGWLEINSPLSSHGKFSGIGCFKVPPFLQRTSGTRHSISV
jgi:hypothetical protein